MASRGAELVDIGARLLPGDVLDIAAGRFFKREVADDLTKDLRAGGCRSSSSSSSSSNSSFRLSSSPESERYVARSSYSSTAEATGLGVGLYTGWEARRTSLTIAVGALAGLVRAACPRVGRDRDPWMLAISLTSRRTFLMTLAPVFVFVRLPLLKANVPEVGSRWPHPLLLTAVRGSSFLSRFLSAMPLMLLCFLAIRPFSAFLSLFSLSSRARSWSFLYFSQTRYHFVGSGGL